MNLTREMMVADGIRFVLDGSLAYFYVEDVKKKYTDVKIHSANVHQKLVDGELIPTVLPQDIEEMDDFDKLLAKTKRFNQD